MSLIKDYVSIPNGMEFYSSTYYAEVANRTFQFPTGWNSTSIETIGLSVTVVSIPNGMEFYLKLT